MRTLRLAELVRWGNPVAPRARTIVVLTDGGQLVTAADWSGGAAVRLEGDTVVVLSDLFGEVRLARDMVRGVVFAQQRDAREREELVERVRGEPSLATASPERPSPSLRGRGNSDVVLLSNGDRVTGTLSALSRGSLTIETNAGAAKLPLSRVDAVVLSTHNEPSLATASPERPSPSLKGRGIIVVGLRDGSLTYANEVLANDKELKLTLGKSVTLNGGKVGDVVFMQPLSERTVYLSDLDAADYRHVPYLSVDWPYKRDQNVLGEPLVAGGKRYLKGIGMHSAGRLSYRLDGKYKRFDASVAIDDAAGGRGSVTFGVYVLRDGKWNDAYKSGIVRGSDTPQPVSVDVSGAQGLTLTVDYADRGDELDRADWLDARLTK
ncbi:MAG: NPCBM/NEW2 domain-containing protein [Planctomycetes bacterium]|nr:NPCBM/NEW2 domain-containing protein [Planctomycetota bacterium]